MQSAECRINQRNRSGEPESGILPLRFFYWKNGGDFMTAREAVDKAKKVSSASEDVLFDACERLEIKIEKYAGIEHRDFKKDGVLLAAGGAVASGYDKMYTAYIKGEGALSMEDWDCYGSYNAIFAGEWEELAKEIVRTRESEGSSFSPDWRWK